MKRQLWFAAALALAVVVSSQAQAARTFWTLDFQHTDLRYIVCGTKIYAYTLYTVTNKTGVDRAFYPIFRVETDTNRLTYAMPMADVTAAIRVKTGKRYLDINEISGKLPDGESKIGVAVFQALDPEADRVKLYVTGLTDSFRYQDEDNRKGYQRMMWKVEWYRPGDAESRLKSPVETQFDEYVWRSTGTAATAPEGVAEEPVRAPAETPAKAAVADTKPAEEKPAE